MRCRLCALVAVPVLILVVGGACARAALPEATVPAVVEPVQKTAWDTLEQMDKRASVPLLPRMANHQKENMRDHLVAVQEIVHALAVDDFTAVARAAGRIGFSAEMGQMCTHMGAGAPGFTEQALHFHHTADGISAAAQENDRKRVLTALDATLQTCTSCHAAWKQQVVDEATWEQLTSQAPPVHGMQH